MIRYVFAADKVLTIKAQTKADPQKIGEALAEISAKANGHLTPEAIVDTAKAKTHILHRHFEWDDKLAAHQYRLDQARDLVQSIHVEAAETESGYARAFLSIREKDGTSYRSLGDVMQSADLQSKVLAAAERDLLAFENRYRSLTDICQMIRAAREQITERRNKHESRAQA